MSMAPPDALDGDRRMLRLVLQSMSDQVAGRSSVGEMVPTESFAAQPANLPEVDEPDEPGVTEVPDPAPQARTSGKYAWGGFANGRIPADKLTKIGQGNHRLESQAAAAWMRMVADAKRQGVNLTLTDSYRSFDQQVAVRKKKGHLVATATPGSSVHGWGRAVDANVKDPKVLKWLHANGPKYGWVNPAWAKKGGKNYEPWHLEWIGGDT